jgi:glycerol-3-phosphate dehydrogenase
MVFAMKSLFVIAVASFVQDLTSFKLSSSRNHLSLNRNLRLQESKNDIEAIRSTELSSSELKFTIMGGGAFSLAMSKILGDKNISISMLVRNQTVADCINENHFHPKYLSDCPLPTQLFATSDAELALKDADYIIHAVPCQQSRKFLTSVKQFMPPNAPIMSVTKGVEEGTFCLMNDIITETLGTERRCAYLSGPSFAREIMAGEATAVVIASEDHLAGQLSKILSSTKFRCHTTRDVKVII